MTPVFHGRVDAAGKLDLSPDVRGLLSVHLRGLAGKAVAVTIRPPRVQRSRSQNDYFHAQPARLLADHWGEDIELAKLLILGECFGWRESVTGERVPVKPSSSRLTVEEFTFLIEWVIAWGMTAWHVTIPFPHEVEA